MIPQRYVPLAVVLTFGSVIPSVVRGGDSVSLGEKVFTANIILEVELAFTTPIPDSWPNKRYHPQGWGFPDQLIRSAVGNAVISRVLFATGDTSRLRLPRMFFLFASNSPCWWRAHRNTNLRALLFFRFRHDGTLEQIFGVEQETGQYTNLNPSYELLVSAVLSACSWSDERIRAVAPEALWQTERSVMRESTNPYEQLLAIEFLERHDASRVVIDEWTEHAAPLRIRTLHETVGANVCRQGSSQR